MGHRMGSLGMRARHVLEFEKPLAQIDRQIHELEALQQQKQVDYAKELRQLRSNYTSLLRKTYDNLTAWETVQVARHPQRPQMRDYIDMICPEFREIHGDRRYGDDPAVVCGLARLGNKIVLIGHHKGRDTKEKIKCFFGLAHPEGYRKALRGMKLAEKFGLPVVTLIDTPGAYPGIGAEERGQAESIAKYDGNEPPENPDRFGRDRRRGQRRRLGPGRGRSGRHDGIRLVFRHQPRSLLGHPFQGK